MKEFLIGLIFFVSMAFLMFLLFSLGPDFDLNSYLEERKEQKLRDAILLNRFHTPNLKDFQSFQESDSSMFLF